MGDDAHLGCPADHPRRRDQHRVGVLNDARTPVVGGEVEDRGLLDHDAADAGAGGVTHRLAPDVARGVGLDDVGLEGVDGSADLAAGGLGLPDADDLTAAVAAQARPRGDDPHGVAEVDEPVHGRLDGDRRAVDRGVEAVGREQDPHGLHGPPCV
nr:hypothetical protein [Nocardioides sp. J9]